MAGITQTPLPDDSLLHAFVAGKNAYTDCFEVTVPCDMDPDRAFERFVYLFFDSPVFRLERIVLRIAGKAPPERTNPQALATGETDMFAAWDVVTRTQTELLLKVANMPIRTWLSLHKEGDIARLRFGSALVPQDSGQALPFAYRATIGLHRLYSRILLWVAVRDWTRGKTL